MKTPRSLAMAAVCSLLAVSPLLARPKATIEVVNKSKWDIHHLYLSSSDERHWGPDQLGDDILEPGDSFTLTHLACDDYDIKVVDEDGDECVIEEVELCREDSIWKLTDKELLSCEGY